jgi:hypothetical protein
VQTKALLILNYLDEIARNKADVFALKRAYLSTGTVDPSKLFPEEFREPPKDTEEVPSEREEEDTEYDYSGVTWKGGSDSIQEYQRLMAQIGAAQQGSMNGDAITSEPTWTEWG